MLRAGRTSAHGNQTRGRRFIGRKAEPPARPIGRSDQGKRHVPPMCPRPGPPYSGGWRSRGSRISFFARQFPSTDPKRKSPDGWPPRTRLFTCRGTRSKWILRRLGMAIRAGRRLRVMPDLQQRTLALPTAPRSNRSRLPAHVCRPRGRPRVDTARWSSHGRGAIVTTSTPFVHIVLHPELAGALPSPQGRSCHEAHRKRPRRPPPRSPGVLLQAASRPEAGERRCAPIVSCAGRRDGPSAWPQAPSRTPRTQCSRLSSSAFVGAARTRQVSHSFRPVTAGRSREGNDTRSMAAGPTRAAAPNAERPPEP
jgi:hypothetical protein